jgi:putative Mg2+ transporter-C (MgtC) family protein
LPDLSWLDVFYRIGLAALLGGAVGIERELREREAGLRTHLLVSVGAALFTLVSAYGFADFRYGFQSGITLDPTRIAAQIVTGIGFIGAGAIIRQGLSVRGVTTAATLWTVAAIGLAAGAGYYSGAVIATAIVLFSLWPLRILAYRAQVLVRPGEARITLELAPEAGAAPVLATLDGLGVGVESLEIDDTGGSRLVVAAVKVADRERSGEVVDALTRLDEVRRVEWRG